MVAPVLGVRETRRIVGDFVYTVEDLIEERDFPDTIGFTGYGWDLPDPKKPSYQTMHGTRRTREYNPYALPDHGPAARRQCNLSGAGYQRRAACPGPPAGTGSLLCHGRRRPV